MRCFLLQMLIPLQPSRYGDTHWNETFVGLRCGACQKQMVRTLLSRPRGAGIDLEDFELASDDEDSMPEMVSDSDDEDIEQLPQNRLDARRDLRSRDLDPQIDAAGSRQLEELIATTPGFDPIGPAAPPPLPDWMQQAGLTAAQARVSTEGLHRVQEGYIAGPLTDESTETLEGVLDAAGTAAFDLPDIMTELQWREQRGDGGFFHSLNDFVLRRMNE